MALLNESGIIGAVISYMTNYVTGDPFYTYFILMAFLVIIAMIFRMPIQLIPVYIFPVVIILISQLDGFMIIGGALMIYLAFAMVFMWAFK